jgi:glycosyltransferase involved in cell wall biosynthesis
LFVGRLQTRKRVDLLIKACAELPAHIQPRLTVVGEGPARAELENLAREIYPRTEFCGYRCGKELDAMFVSADLFILPGTGGLAVQQAMSHALPVIVGKADGSQSNLVFSENGWLLPTEEAFQLKDIILEALTDIPRLRQMGIQSYRIVREEVNIEKMIDVFTCAILEVCKD